MTTLQQLDQLADRINDDSLTWANKFKLIRMHIKNKKADEELQIKRAYNQGKIDTLALIPYANSQDDYFDKICKP